MKFEFKGWKAIPVALLFVGFLIYRAVAAHAALEGEAAEEIKLHLIGVYSSQEMGELKTAYASGDSQRLSAEVDEIVGYSRIEFTSVCVKGLGDTITVRLAISVDGKLPPDGREIRYFRLEHSTLTGWRVKREVTAFRYYSKLF